MKTTSPDASSPTTCALLSVNLCWPDPIFRSAGMVHACGVRRSNRAAPNSLTRSGRLLLRTGDGRSSPATPQKPLRADAPAKQNGKLGPRRVTVSGRRRTGGIETSGWSGRLPLAASAQLVHTRWSDCIGWAMAHRGRDGCSGHRREGQSQSQRGRACAAARQAGSSPTSTSRKVQSPLLPQFGVELPTPGRSRPVNASSSVHRSPRQGFCYPAPHPFRKRFGSKGTCLRHKW
jgi:hypothetical protein